MRIEATKNAKKIANEMLSAIGQSVGNALFIGLNTGVPNVYPRRVDMNEGIGQYYDMSTIKGGAVVQYQKIKIAAVVSARFEIK